MEKLIGGILLLSLGVVMWGLVTMGIALPIWYLYNHFVVTQFQTPAFGYWTVWGLVVLIGLVKGLLLGNLFNVSVQVKK